MAEVLGSYVAHGTHTKFAAVIKNITTSSTATKTTITITATGRHYNNDTHANTVSANSLNGIISFTGSGSVSPADVDYPTADVSVAAGVGKTADGNTLTYTITVSRTASDITISNIKFYLTSSVSDKTSTATWGSSITVPAATVNFSPQTLASKTFSTSAQTSGAFSAASGGSGNYSYTKGTEKNANDATTNYFTLNSNRTFTIAASTPASTYKIVVTAKDTTTNASSSVAMQITISKANISPTITMANWAYGGTASTPSVSGNTGGGTVTYKYKLKSAADSTYSTTKPSDAGTYTIQATITATTNYNASTVTKDFSITFTATPTAYSAAYNGSAHSASIKTSAPGVTVNYGTSTSYGKSLTCTNANTNYAMSGVTYTNFTNGAKTVYYSATKNGYTVTSSTTINITKATPTTFTVTGATLNYNGSAQTLVSAASITGGGVIYYGLGSSTTSAPSSWSTTKPTATNVGSYYIWAKADASDNYNAVSQVYKATATIKPVMWLKYHANGGTIADAPHKYSDTQYFKLNNSLVQLSSTSTGTFSDVVGTIYTSTTYANLYNVTTFNITRTGHHVKSGAAAYNTATNGTGVDVNQDNTAATDSNPVTTKRINGGTEITANVTKTLYVNWVANTWTFTFAGGGNTGGSMSNQVHTYGVALALPAVGFTKTGYSFKRWNYNNSNYYNDKQEISGTWTSTNGNTYTLTAEWTANTYGVTLNANGGSGGTSSVTATYDSAMPSARMPTRLGYTFAGYYDAASGGTQYYTAAGASARTWNKTAATTLYAHWNMITVPAHVKIDSAWKNGTIWIKVNGTWKQASVGYIKVSGAWKQIK